MMGFSNVNLWADGILKGINSVKVKWAKWKMKINLREDDKLWTRTEEVLAEINGCQLSCVKVATPDGRMEQTAVGKKTD